MPIGVVLADAEFDSEANHRHVRGTLGAHCIIPAKPRRGVLREEESVTRCTALFRGSCMGRAPK